MAGEKRRPGTNAPSTRRRFLAGVERAAEGDLAEFDDVELADS